MISVRFHLHRHMGSFLIQVYGPCILLVVLSWVSFWLNREATADRVSLGTFTNYRQSLSVNNRILAQGVTTVLTMTFLGLEARANLPKVTYPTALDHFIFLSFGFIFATIVQVRDIENEADWMVTHLSRLPACSSPLYIISLNTASENSTFLKWLSTTTTSNWIILTKFSLQRRLLHRP